VSFSSRVGGRGNGCKSRGGGGISEVEGGEGWAWIGGRETRVIEGVARGGLSLQAEGWGEGMMQSRGGGRDFSNGRGRGAGLIGRKGEGVIRGEWLTHRVMP